ncbi:MAG: radical SAM protein [Acidobacteria bacterium]|nr:radical SAM protein [Acidobacteriota bacterium]
MALAAATAWLHQAGLDVRACDLAVDRLPADALDGVTLVAVSLPMHTATRLALPVVRALRQRAPGLPICAFGLYAPLNEGRLRDEGVSLVLGPECETDLVTAARAAASPGARAVVAPGPAATPATAATSVAALGRRRGSATVPDRTKLPSLDRYARLQWPDGRQDVVGAVESTRGCKHRCRHCPIVPVYEGRFVAVPADTVLADIRWQVEQGASHITFADPDFFNGPTHATRIVEALHRTWPDLTYDATIKVEHLRVHDALLPLLVETGCAFVTTAVESLDDRVLALLEKGHTRADVEAVAARCQRLGLALSPTFLAFTPWTTLDSYRQFLDDVDALGLVQHVTPVQWTLRLLVTQRSRLLELADIQAVMRRFDPATLTHPWTHPDPCVDALQRDVMARAGLAQSEPREVTFRAIRALADEAAGRSGAVHPPLVARAAIPYLTEPWYC